MKQYLLLLLLFDERNKILFIVITMIRFIPVFQIKKIIKFQLLYFFIFCTFYRQTVHAGLHPACNYCTLLAITALCVQCTAPLHAEGNYCTQGAIIACRYNTQCTVVSPFMQLLDSALVNWLRHAWNCYKLHWCTTCTQAALQSTFFDSVEQQHVPCCNSCTQGGSAAPAPPLVQWTVIHAKMCAVNGPRKNKFMDDGYLAPFSSICI